MMTTKRTVSLAISNAAYPGTAKMYHWHHFPMTQLSLQQVRQSHDLEEGEVQYWCLRYFQLACAHSVSSGQTWCDFDRGS